VIAHRVERVTSLVEELTAQRAEDRIGTEILVLVDDDDAADDAAAASSDMVRMGRGAHQAPEVDGNVTIHGGPTLTATDLRPGDLVRCRVDGSDGIDLLVTALELASSANGAMSIPPQPSATVGRA
jgi:ribosomal protein S12 methylthiotransferase